MQFSQVGEPIVPGQEPELAPGVRGFAFDTENGPSLDDPEPVGVYSIDEFTVMKEA